MQIRKVVKLEDSQYIIYKRLCKAHVALAFMVILNKYVNK